MLRINFCCYVTWGVGDDVVHFNKTENKTNQRENQMKCISFDEIVQGRDANVRVTDDGYVFAVDLVMVVTGKDRDHASLTIRRISDDVFLSENFVQRTFSGSCKFNG